MTTKKTKKSGPSAAPAQADHPMGEAPDPFPTPTPLWLRRFLMGLAGFYGALCLSFGAYTVYGQFLVVAPAREAIADGSPEALTRALGILETPHLFSGYAPYHGFGGDKAKEVADAVDGVVAAGTPYTEAQQQELLRWASYWLTAAETHKVQGKVPWLPGDALVLTSLMERWENALATSRVFLIYLALVAVIFGGLFLVYRRKKLFDRIGPLPS